MEIGTESKPVEYPRPVDPNEIPREEPAPAADPIAEPIREPAKAIKAILDGEMTLTEWQGEVVNSILNEARRG